MPNGKPAGVRCIQLTDDNRCAIFGMPERPEVCVHLKPAPEMCGVTAVEAMVYLSELEVMTKPGRVIGRQ
jgi:uncharacterized protein